MRDRATITKDLLASKTVEELVEHTSVYNINFKLAQDILETQYQEGKIEEKLYQAYKVLKAIKPCNLTYNGELLDIKERGRELILAPDNAVTKEQLGRLIKGKVVVGVNQAYYGRLVYHPET